MSFAGPTLAPATLAAFALFALVASVTPGPNNLMLLASGVNFGFKRTVPHIAGISCGFVVLVVAVGVGLAKIFVALPVLYIVLKWAGAVYMLYLAWNIARASKVADTAEPSGLPTQPMTFLGAAAFQWVNPKAWVMAVSAFSTYVPVANSLGLVSLVALLFGLINAPSVCLWAFFGSGMKRYLSVERHLRRFNYTMAALLVLSLYPLLTDG